jgi:DNA-binding CsgD family transcriptional regulator/PAS domain-containing protein
MYKPAMSRASRSSSSLDALIEWLYDAAVDARAWDGIAPALATTFGADSAVFKLHGNTGVHLLELTDNLHTAPREDAWANHWHRNDLWVERTLALNTSGIVTSQQLLPDAEFERSGYYQDWNRRLGVYHMIGSVFPVASGLSGVVGIHRPRGGSSFGAMERRRLAKLLPHLQRAMRIRSQLTPSRLVANAQAAAFDRLHTSALVLDADGRLLHANVPGESLLREGSNLALSAGRVVAVNPHLGFRWRLLVQQAARAVGGSLLFERAGRPPLTALVAPLRGASYPNAAVLVMLRDPEHQAPSPDLLCQLFGLTATEAKVAAAIAEGQAPEQIARRMDIGVGTVRSHLRQVLTKTGTHRQNELAALITRSVAMLGEIAHLERG